ncbi:MAG: MFS transporter [Bacteroidetes bacterium]|nr:MAG: MFS transporter [Bacteroidota bacterium]
MSQSKTNYGALTVLISVFFFWGFIAAGNSIFIPFCKTYFKLDQFQSLLIDFAFYFAYYIGALLLFMYGTMRRRDLVGSWGYKNTIVYGLLFSALGAGAMIISVYYDQFVGMLFGLFIVALGFSLQQTAANPFMIALGDESTGSNRISLGGGINSLGTTIAPLIVGLILFGSTKVTDEMKENLSLEKVIYLYAFVGMLFLGVALLFSLSKRLPSGKQEVDETKNQSEPSTKALAALLIMTGLLITCFAPVLNSYRTEESKKVVQLQDHYESLKKHGATTLVLEQKQQEIDVLRKPLEKRRLWWLGGGLLVVLLGIPLAYGRARKQKKAWGAMQYPQLSLGMLAIFIYVGVEVTIGSNLGELLRQEEFGYEYWEITPFVALFWGSLMVGRWVSAIHVFDLSKQMKNILTVIVPLVAFSLVLLFSYLAGHQVEHLYPYVICVLILTAAFHVSQNKPALTLMVFGILGAISAMIGVFGSGMLAIYGLMGAGLFCSIMWPCIFSLSLAGTGVYRTQGSAFLIMMILGGAIIPPVQGKLMDIVSAQHSFLLAVACFLYIAFFAFYVGKMLKRQGASLDD